jgi:hypothetical protein
MNECYTKLNWQLDNFDWEAVRGNLVGEYKYVPNLSYYEITDHAKIREIFPAQIFKIGACQFKFVEITGIGLLAAHTDFGLATVLNYYFNPAGSITRWYNTKESAVQTTSIEEETHSYKYADLELADEFVAQQGDVYLINVSKVHDVVHLNKLPRQFIQIQWKNFDYKTVLDALTNDFRKT